MTTRRPVEVFPPGEFLREELEERGWTQSDLADIIGRPVGMISEIITGKRGVSPETARGFAAAFGTSAELWMNLEASYQLSKVKDDSQDLISHRAKLYDKAPMKDMIRRGWIESSDNILVLEEQLLRFFRIKHIDDEPELFTHAARKGTSYGEPTTVAQNAWLFRASQLARTVHAAPFSERSVPEAISKLRLLAHAPQEVRHVPRILSDVGIRFVIVQPLPGSRIDGACFWVDNSPVIAMSMRFDRIDNFWFVLLHELGHVSKGVDVLDVELDSAKNDNAKPDFEREADEFATENLVPRRQLDNFIARVRPVYSTRKITAFAMTIGVHPGIVVGQLQHRGEIAYSSFRTLMVPIRDWITASAITDGWGTSLPANL